MKPKKVKKKLSLSKKTVASLNAGELNLAKGGYEKTAPYYCISNRFCSEYPFNCETRLWCSVPYCETDPAICF